MSRIYAPTGNLFDDAMSPITDWWDEWSREHIHGKTSKTGEDASGNAEKPFPWLLVIGGGTALWLLLR